MTPPDSDPKPDAASASAPNFEKVGFGAMGNVSVTNDTSRHHHEVHQNSHQTTHHDHSQVTHIYHGSDERGQWNILLIVAVLLGLMGVVLAFGLLNRDQPPTPVPAPVPAPAAPLPSVVMTPVVQPEAIYNPAPPDAPPGAPQAEVPLLTMTTAKKRYLAGEVVEFSLTARQDGYVRLIYRDAGGQSLQVLPNAVHDGRLLAGQPFHWNAENLRRALPGSPGKEQVIRLRVSGPPFGHEEFVAVFSDQPFTDAPALAAALSSSRSGMSTPRLSKAIDLEIEEVIKTVPKGSMSYETRCQIETMPGPAQSAPDR